MIKRPWYPRNTSDYAKDTRLLTLEQHGAYTLLIDYYWDCGLDSLPDNEDQLKLIFQSIWKEKPKKTRELWIALRGFFILKDGRFHHKRLDNEIIKATDLIKKRIDNGKKGGLAKARAIAKAKAVAHALAIALDININTNSSSINTTTKKKTKKKSFKPPLEKEVIDYFIENNFSEDLGKRAFEFYDVAQWHNSKGKKVLNWKQTMMNNWFKNEEKKTEDGKYKTTSGKLGRAIEAFRKQSENPLMKVVKLIEKD